MFKQQFLHVLLGALSFPFFGGVFLGVLKGLEYDSAWIGFKVWMYIFIFVSPFFIAPKWRVLKSLAKGNRL